MFSLRVRVCVGNIYKCIRVSLAASILDNKDECLISVMEMDRPGHLICFEFGMIAGVDVVIYNSASKQ